VLRGYNPHVMSDIERRRAGATRVIGLHDDDGAFDAEFWAGQPMAARLDAMWDLALEWMTLQGHRGDQPRLQRSVCRVERRGR
jgi:hypothetical protein